MLREVTLAGVLGERFGAAWRLDVATPAEAVRAIEANQPGFAQYLLDSAREGLAYVVYAGDRDLTEAQLADPLGAAPLRIVPVVQGAGDDGVLNIIIGVALLATVFFMPANIANFGVILQTSATTAVGVTIGSTLTFVGAGLVLKGTAQLLAPTPDATGIPERAENTPNHQFSGPVNTIAQGGPVPVGYGRLRIGSHIISAGIENADIGTGS